MPDENEKEEETKTTEEFKVPPFAVDAAGRWTTRGIADHARAMYARLWDKAQKRFTSLKQAVQLLLVYVPRIADRIADVEEYNRAFSEGITARISNLEGWRTEIDKVLAEGRAMAERIEQEMESNPDLAKLKEQIDGKPQLKSVASIDGAGLPGDPSSAVTKEKPKKGGAA